MCRASRKLSIVALTVMLVCAQDPGAARKALQFGDYVQAEQIYRALLAGAPKSAELLNNLAVALYFQGKSSEATALFQRAMDIKPLPATLALLAAKECRLQQGEQAAGLLHKLTSEKPGPELLNVAAACYLQAGDPLEAITAYSALRHSREYSNDQTAVGLARAYFQASKYFLDLLEKLPGDKRPYLRAIENARSQSSPNARGAEAEALKSASYIGSQPTFDHLAALWPRHSKDPALAYLLGVECGELAMTSYLQCEKDYPDSLALAQLQAEMLAHQGRYDDALAHLRQLAARVPESADLHRDLGLTYYRTGHYADALTEFERQSRLEPHSEEPEVAISKCLLQLGRLDDAAARLKPMVETERAPDWALLDWATVQQDLGQVSQAIGALKRLEERDTSNVTVHYRLAQLYSRVGNHAEAAREFAAFSRLTPKPDRQK